MDDECQILQPQLLDKAFDVFDMVKEIVLQIGFVRFAHANQIHGNAAAVALHVGDNIAPQIRRGRIAMQKQNRIA